MEGSGCFVCVFLCLLIIPYEIIETVDLPINKLIERNGLKNWNCLFFLQIRTTAEAGQAWRLCVLFRQRQWGGDSHTTAQNIMYIIQLRGLCQIEGGAGSRGRFTIPSVQSHNSKFSIHFDLLIALGNSLSLILSRGERQFGLSDI
jgi:hypothetical protein